MLEQPICPACGHRAWRPVTQHVFTKKKMQRNSYERLRSRVLFEVWAPGTDKFVAQFVMCRRCGFVCFTPRPTGAEVDAKYRLIAEVRSPQRPVKDLDLQRSAVYYDILAPHLGERRELLDFGGGKGVLLSSFIKHGFDCGVVDYTTGTVPGVEWLGNTLADLPADRRFDLVLSSHVFEHLADPMRTACELRKVLRSNGLLFIEVPLELVRRVTRRSDPVTHINFFTPASLRVLLNRAGFDVIRCRQEQGLFASGVYRPAVRALASVASQPPEVHPPGSQETRALLRLRLRDKLSSTTERVRKRAKTLQKELKSGCRGLKRQVRRRLLKSGVASRG